MAIRIRKVAGRVVALCAALSEPVIGDLYLDDAQHHALTVKFDIDFASEEFNKKISISDDLQAIIRGEQGGKLY